MSLRRFSFAPLVFLALWALWFALPTTRSIALSAWKASLSPAPTPSEPALGIYSPNPPSPTGSSRDAQFVRALNSWQPTITTVGFKASNNRYKALESLRVKFPDDPAICAAQIVAMFDLLHLSQNRHFGPSSGGANWSVKHVDIETVPPQILQSWFAATARGAKLEPNNTFWDWAKIVGLLASGRDSEVWPVLRAARGKTIYADHVEEGDLASLRVAQSQGVLSPVQQISISYASIFPHYASMREAARQVSDYASGLRLWGGPNQKKQALEGMRDFVLLARVMRRESKTYIGGLVAEATESIALYGGSYSPTATIKVVKPVIGSALWIYTTNPRSLAFFAQQMKRPDIVKQLGREWNDLGTWHRKVSGAWRTSPLLGINQRDLWVAHGGSWFGSLLIASMPALLALALASSALLWLVPTWRRERELQPSMASWGWGAGLGVTALLVLSSGPFYLIGTAMRTTGASSFDIFISSMSSSQTQSGPVPPSWQSYFWSAQCFVVALWFAVAWNNKRLRKTTLSSRLRSIFSAPDDEMTRFDLSPILSLAGVFAAAFLATVGLLSYLIVPLTARDYASLHSNAELFLCLFAFVFAFPALWQLRNPQSRAFALILARRLAWGQLIFLTLLWGLLWMAVTPFQKRFDAGLKRYIQVGELQLFRKSAGI